MCDDKHTGRRKLLKASTAAGLGAIHLSGSAAGGKNRPDNEDHFNAENYVETEEYIYRRVQTSETEMLLRLDLEKGEAAFAEIKLAETKPDEGGSASITSLSEDEELKNQVRTMTGIESVTAAEDNDLNPEGPAEIVEATDGVSVASNGVIFEEVDVASEELGECGTIGYDDHYYYHIAMELGDYEFDDLGDAIAYGVVCDALFILVGSKSKTIKELLKKISDTPLIRAIPDSICAFIFGTVLDGVFSGGDGTVAFWDRESGGLISTSELVFGGSTLYDPSPSYIRNRGSEEEFTGVHTELFK